MNRADGPVLEIVTSPHVTGDASVDRIMRDVLVALLPVCAFSTLWFGLPALTTLSAAVAACLLTERVLGKAGGMGDWSAAVTGVLYGLTLPATLPIWMTVLGAIVGVGVGKFAFGGLGFNVFNPALVGRAFLQATFPLAMTHWPTPADPGRWLELPSELLTYPFARPTYDAISAATPLASFKFEGHVSTTGDLLLGLTGGSLGETSSLLLLAGGVYLLHRRVINWRIPLGLLTAVVVLCALGHWLTPEQFASPMFNLFSGGLMLGALYMATDPVASPTNQLGCWIYGVLIGALVVGIRGWGGLPEGVMYAILIGNACSPLINRWTQPLCGHVRPRIGDG